MATRVSLPSLVLSLSLLLSLQDGGNGGGGGVEAALVVRVDARNGNDSLCLSAQQLISANISESITPWPCQTLNAALGHQSCDSSCVADGNALSDVEFELTNGVYRLTGCIGLVEASNIVLRPARDSSDSDVTIECQTFPNNVVGYYDNLVVCNSDNVTFERIQFTRCGPQSPNVFLNISSGILFDNCLFVDNTGASLQGEFCDDITLRDTQFLNNINNITAEPDHNETSIDDLYSSITTAGAFTFFTRSRPVRILIERCVFRDNSANRNDENNTRPVLLKANGHGGAILIRLADTADSEITIVGSLFLRNTAQVDGGAIYLSLSESVSNTTMLLARNNFTLNTVEKASGGAVSINSFNISYANNISVDTCHFERNSGDAGGAFSVALYDSDITSSRNPDSVDFRNCTFVSNEAENEGTAVGLFSLVHVDQVGFPVGFEDCEFMNNTSVGETEDTSAIAAFRFPITFNGTNRFLGNLGGGVTLLNTQMKARGVLEFDNNTAVFGGGIAMDDRCLLEISPNTNISFTNNVARESGGGIYVEFPPIRFVVDIFNRLCFLQYKDPEGGDIPPQNWTGVHISFINNTARLSGAAIYASDMQQCSWLGSDHTDDESLIFTPPTQLPSPFQYSGNQLISEGSIVMNRNLATAPSTIDIELEDDTHSLVQPGESLAISLLARDQVNNSREAVWSLEAPNQDVNLDALSANQDTYVYVVPCALCLNHTDNSADCDCEQGPTTSGAMGEGEDEISSDMFSADIQLNFSLLRTLGEIRSLNLSVDGCHPGYTYNTRSGVCACDTDNTNILRCDDNSRYLYLREGVWGGVSSDRSLITERVQPGFVSCRPQGRLPGCLYEFDNEDAQCREERKGRMCGTCRDDFGVTLDLQQCSENCAAGLPVFLLLCVSVVTLSFLIMFFDIELPNELKGFVFYAQVIGLVYRPYVVVQTTTTGLNTFLSIVVNLLGFSLPFPLCLSTAVQAHYVALLGYISPILAMLTVAGYIFSARFSKHLSNRSSLKGITFLSLFIYKYIADTAFIFISCTDTHEYGLVFQYDGSVQCTSPEFVVLFVIGLILVIFFVIPAPFAISYICIRRPQKFQQYADVLTKGLQPRYRWWGGWDIGRRLPFVFIGFFLVLLRPSLVLFLMSLAALAVLILHLFIKPYDKMHTNVIETAILLNLLMVVAAFLDPSNRPVPEWLSTILVLLPYCYAVGYITWRVGTRLWMKFGSRIVHTKKTTDETPPTNKELGPAPQEGEVGAVAMTARSTPPTTNSEPPTATTDLSATGGSDTPQPSPSLDTPPSAAPAAGTTPPQPAKAPPPPHTEQSFNMLREPLLDF